MPLDPDAAAVLSAMQAQGLPPMETLTPQEVRDRTAAAAALSAGTRCPRRLGGRTGPGWRALPRGHTRGGRALRRARLAPRRRLGHRQRAAVAPQRQGAGDGGWRRGRGPRVPVGARAPLPGRLRRCRRRHPGRRRTGRRVGRPDGQGRRRWRLGRRQPGGRRPRCSSRGCRSRSWPIRSSTPP